jgi:hypothetical protein
MDTQALGLGTETATWAIKDFSVVLRQQITQAARRQDCTVAEWLAGYFVRHGIEGQQFEAVKMNGVEPVQANGGGVGSIGDLCALAEAAARLAETKDRMPRGLRGKLSSRLQQALRTPLEEAARSGPKLIAAPDVAGDSGRDVGHLNDKAPP